MARSVNSSFALPLVWVLTILPALYNMVSVAAIVAGKLLERTPSWVFQLVAADELVDSECLFWSVPPCCRLAV
ncbi:hypothetical protein [Methylomonas methanica]|uniref:hypothetical protein n=1 Tax=Methylomonas methanica TaxID=421 RepID=UPI0012F683F9|nr:hypothetical protein [Methylomonas methanica]